MWSLKLKCAEPVDEALQGGRLDALGAADDAQHPAEVQPGEVGVGRLAGGQVEGEVGRRRPRVGILGQRSHPAGRSLEERRPGSSAGRGSRPGSARRRPAPDPCRDRRAATTRSWYPAATLRVREEAAHQLLEVHRQVAVRHHHAGRQPRRTRAVLQIRDVRQIGCSQGSARPRRPDSARRSRRSSARCPSATGRRSRRRLRPPRSS